MDDMEALMGFSSFGGGAASNRKRRAAQHKQTGAVATHSQWPPVQVAPGTELCEQLQRSCDPTRLETGAHGVTFLVSDSSRDGVHTRSRAGSLAALLSSPTAVSCNGNDHAATAELLPARSYELLDKLQHEKNRFDELSSTTFRRARAVANPYESVGRGPFLNRSAMKLVNLDHVFQLTTANGSLFTFADVCGGPGGFSEYLLWRGVSAQAAAAASSAQPRGYGISLKDEICDWKLGPHASFEISYGDDGTGDLYKLSNIRHFRDKVVLQNHPLGVDLVVADGGFQDARDQRNQELMMTRLVLAEVLTMFSVLSAGGNFVCKTFELATPVMLQLVWLLHKCFEKITVVKPVTSRPASSERYLVAMNRHKHLPMDAIIWTLEARLEAPEGGMNLLFDASVVSADACFLEFMAAVNDRLAQAQIDACRRILDIANGGSKRKRWTHSWHIDPRKIRSLTCCLFVLVV